MVYNIIRKFVFFSMDTSLPTRIKLIKIIFNFHKITFLGTFYEKIQIFIPDLLNVLEKLAFSTPKKKFFKKITNFAFAS